MSKIKELLLSLLEKKKNKLQKKLDRISMQIDEVKKTDLPLTRELSPLDSLRKVNTNG